MTTVSTLAQHVRLQAQIRSTRQEVDRLTQEIGSGTHADPFAALGGDASRWMALRRSFEQISFYEESARLAATQLAGQQTAMTALQTTATEMRGLLLGVQSGADDGSPRTIGEGARNALEQVRGVINQAVGGRFLFSGPAVTTPPLREPDVANAAGNSPTSVLAAIKAGYGSLADPVSMASFLDEVHQVFAGTHPNPDWTFEKVFYAGSTTGAMAVAIDRASDVSLDVRASHPALRGIVEALYVLDAVPATLTSADSYRVMAAELSERLTIDLGRLVDLTAEVGYRQQLVAETLTRHAQTSAVVNNNLAALESIDDYAAATRLTALQTQLELSYTITARLSRLSLASYL
jgi:flagellar hook-associated protein 3 FlgL